MMTKLSVHRVPAMRTASGPPVVLLHGFASRGSADWPDEDWAIPLSSSGREVLVIDLPGHGGSPRPSAPPRASEVLSAIAESALVAGDIVDVVGYSLGARLAWDLDGASGLAVRRLVLGGLSPIEPFSAVDLDAARRAVDGGAGPADALTAVIVAMSAAPGNDPHALLDLVEGLAATPFAPGSRPPDMPTLVIAGADDPMTAGVEALADTLPDSQLVRVPGDHLAALHSPELRAAAVNFLTS